MLVDGVADPVDSGVVTDGVVGGVNEDDLEELEGGVLSDPVRVEDAELGDSAAYSALSDHSVVSLGLQLVDSHGFGLTADLTLFDLFLTSSSTDSNSVDDESLLGLVSEHTGLLDSGRSGASVDDGELSVLPGSDSHDELHDFALFLSPKFLKVFVSSHSCDKNEETHL